MQEYGEALTNLQVSTGNHAGFSRAGYYPVSIFDTEPEQFVANRAAYQIDFHENL